MFMLATSPEELVVVLPQIFDALQEVEPSIGAIRDDLMNNTFSQRQRSTDVHAGRGFFQQQAAPPWRILNNPNSWNQASQLLQAMNISRTRQYANNNPTHIQSIELTGYNDESYSIQIRLGHYEGVEPNRDLINTVSHNRQFRQALQKP